MNISAQTIWVERDGCWIAIDPRDLGEDERYWLVHPETDELMVGVASTKSESADDE